MFDIVGNRIGITKGDSAEINVELQGYTMVSGDKLTMTVRKRPSSGVLMQVISNTNTIKLTPTDTKKLPVGNCYFDIELKTSDGDVYTVVGVTDHTHANMTVYPEITE